MKKETIQSKLVKLMEEGKYNMKELTYKLYGDTDWIHYANLSSHLSMLRAKGFHYHPQGRNGVVKIPENLQEFQLTHKLNYNRTKGKTLRYLKFVRIALLEEPKLRKEINKSLSELIMIAQSNP
jgi:hypothetical protein